VVGLTTLSAYVAPLVAEQQEQPIVAAIDARHDHVYCQTVAGNGAPLIGLLLCRSRKHSRPRASARYGWWAMPLVSLQTAGRATPMPSLVDPKPGPDIGWVAWRRGNRAGLRTGETVLSAPARCQAEARFHCAGHALTRHDAFL
jgi:tRNA A37 threonylcarbamoyladenosine modification protein TsaB